MSERESLRDALHRKEPMTDFERVRQALKRGENDARLLDGRDFDRQPWTNAKAALSRIERRLTSAEGDRDALKEVLGG